MYISCHCKSIFALAMPPKKSASCFALLNRILSREMSRQLTLYVARTRRIATEFAKASIARPFLPKRSRALDEQSHRDAVNCVLWTVPSSHEESYLHTNEDKRRVFQEFPPPSPPFQSLYYPFRRFKDAIAVATSLTGRSGCGLFKSADTRHRAMDSGSARPLAEIGWRLQLLRRSACQDSGGPPQ